MIQKICVAAKLFSKNQNIDFICEEITRYSYRNKDVIILTDVLSIHATKKSGRSSFTLH